MRRSEHRPADTHVQAAVGEQLVLLRNTGLNLVDDQAGVTALDLVQDLRHRIVAGVDDPDPQRGGRLGRAARMLCRPVQVSKYLPRLVQEHHADRGQRDVVRSAVEEPHLQLPLEPLDLLAQ